MDVRPEPLRVRKEIELYPAMFCTSCKNVSFFHIGPLELGAELNSENFLRADNFQHPNTRADIICVFCDESRLVNVEYNNGKPENGEIKTMTVKKPIIK